MLKSWSCSWSGFAESELHQLQVFLDRSFTERNPQNFWPWYMSEPWCLELSCSTLDRLCIFQRSWLWSLETLFWFLIDIGSCQDVSRMCDALLECEQRRFSVPNIHAACKNSGRNGKKSVSNFDVVLLQPSNSQRFHLHQKLLLDAGWFRLSHGDRVFQCAH
jgi:hypothetical protein